MPAMRPYPLLFEPLYKPKLWGGDSIFTHFAHPRPVTVPIGESWELADLENDQSCVRNGPAAGRTLGELRETWSRELLGPAPLFEGRFPLLIKFLDAHAWLSVQVHPSEAVARRLGGNVRVKHEAWYVLAAEPGGAIYHGLEPGVTAAAFREAMLTGRVDGILRKVPVHPGECYYLPSGTPHALGKGVLVAEIQTPSHITYRTYDWGRVDPATGQPRELHLDAAIECIDFDAPSPPAIQALPPSRDKSRTHLVACEWFTIDRVTLSESVRESMQSRDRQRAEPASTGISTRKDRFLTGAAPLEPTASPTRPNGAPQQPEHSAIQDQAGASPTANPCSSEMCVWIWLDGKAEILRTSGERVLSLTKGDVVLWPAAATDARVHPSPDAVWLEVGVPARH
ncbi:MAG: class I mannose-6-phosphate isomerase [Phycisphaerae bacterium]|nr:class I mannose-6-phosphate isomerase [Phycisphaerae bacterium]